MGDFLATLVPQYEVLCEDPLRVHVELEKPFDVFEELRVDRCNWTSSELNNGLVWCAGGGLCIVDERFIPLIRRSEDAPSNPGLLGLPTGLSDSKEEWQNPFLLVREMLEELLFVDERNVPVFPELVGLPDLMSSVVHDVESIWKGNVVLHGLKPDNANRVPFVFERKFCTDEVTCKYLGQEVKTTGLVFLSPPQINFVFPFSIKWGRDIEELKILDCETLSENGSRRSMNREVVFLDMVTRRFFSLRARAWNDYRSDLGSQFTNHILSKLGV